MQQNTLAKLAHGCIVSASRCGWQQQLHLLFVPHASLGFAASVSTTTTLRDADGHNHGELTASTSAAQAPLHKPSHRAPKVPGLAVPTKLAGIEYQPALLPSGSRAADPGEPKYTAPYWVPQEARQRLGLPNVLFVEPWRAAEDPALRRMHAQLCMEYLQAAGKPLSAENIFHGVNQQHGAVFAHPGYVRTLMEHLRRERFVYGRRNPDSELSPSMPYHPRMYAPLPYQQTEFGKPKILAVQAALHEKRKLVSAYKRLRNSKSPFPINRRLDHFSVLQYAQAMEALRSGPAQQAEGRL